MSKCRLKPNTLFHWATLDSEVKSHQDNSLIDLRLEIEEDVYSCLYEIVNNESRKKEVNKIKILGIILNVTTNK